MANFLRELHWFLEHSVWAADLIHEGLNGLAAVAAATAEDVLAAKLAGAADAATSDRHSAALAERLQRTFFRPARARVGEERWIAAYDQGRALSPEEAYATARAALERIGGASPYLT